MQEHLPHVTFLLNASQLILDTSVYHYAKRELVELEAAIGTIKSDISMGQAAIAYHRNILKDKEVADSNIKQADIYQAQAESLKAQANYKSHLLHLEDLMRAKLVMESVMAGCEVIGHFQNEAVCQIYERAEYLKSQEQEVTFALPFFDDIVYPRTNHLTQEKIEQLLVSVATLEENAIETTALPE